MSRLTPKEKQELAKAVLPAFLRTTTVAELLDVHRDTVMSMITDGRLEAVRFEDGGQYRIPRESYERYVASLQKVQPKEAA